MPDPFIAVQNAMTPDAVQAAMDHALLMNPQLQGAHLADVLEMYYENDAMLNIMEPFLTERVTDTLIQEVPMQYVSAAILAVGLMFKEPEALDAVGVLMVELVAVVAANNDGVHGSFGGEGRGVADQEPSHLTEEDKAMGTDGK